MCITFLRIATAGTPARPRPGHHGSAGRPLPFRRRPHHKHNLPARFHGRCCLARAGAAANAAGPRRPVCSGVSECGAGGATAGFAGGVGEDAEGEIGGGQV